MAKVAVALASEFEDSELTHPAVALEEAGLRREVAGDVVLGQAARRGVLAHSSISPS